MCSDKKGTDSRPRRIASLALFSSAIAFASRSVHNTWMEYAMLAAAFCMFGACIVMLVRAGRKRP